MKLGILTVLQKFSNKSGSDDKDKWGYVKTNIVFMVLAINGFLMGKKWWTGPFTQFSTH